jgi:hypothetical protein
MLKTLVNHQARCSDLVSICNQRSWRKNKFVFLSSQNKLYVHRELHRVAALRTTVLRTELLCVYIAGLNRTVYHLKTAPEEKVSDSRPFSPLIACYRWHEQYLDVLVHKTER